MRHRGFRVSMMQWCYKNKKLDETIYKFQKSLDELDQMMKQKEKKKKQKI